MAGAVSDSRGRRPVVLCGAALSLVGSVALASAGHHVWLLFAGRLLAGLSAGAAFSAGTAWLRELSRPPYGSASDHLTARRAAIAMTSGFALGPLVSGLLAQWVALPRVVPYLPHIALAALVLALLPRSPETLSARGGGVVGGSLLAVRSRRFRRAVVPVAAWVFVAPAVAFALLPSVVGTGHAADGIALTAAITTLCAIAGVVAQPVARRLDASGGRNRAASAGLLVLVAGLLLAALTAYEGENWLLVPTAIMLGGAYGLCLVAGLVEVQRLARQHALARVTAIYYAIAYLGFAAPYLFALAANLASYTVLLLIASGLAVLTAVTVRRADAEPAGTRGVARR